MVTKGHMTISEGTDIAIRGQGNQNLVMFYHTLLPKHFSIEYDGLSSVNIADKIYIDCAENASVSTNQSSLALLTDVSTQCLYVAGVEFITFQDDVILVTHSTEIQGVYSLKGRRVLSPHDVIVESDRQQSRLSANDTFQIAGKLQVSITGLQYTRHDALVAHYNSSSPLLLIFKHTAEISNGVSSTPISELLYSDQVLNINDGSTTWASAAGPLSFSITDSVINIYQIEESQSVAHYQLSTSVRNFCTHSYSKFNHSALVLPFNHKSSLVAINHVYIPSEDIVYLPSSGDVLVGMLSLEVNISTLLVSSSRFILGSNSQPVLTRELEKAKYVIKDGRLVIAGIWTYLCV